MKEKQAMFYMFHGTIRSKEAYICRLITYLNTK